MLQLRSCDPDSLVNSEQINILFAVKNRLIIYDKG